MSANDRHQLIDPVQTATTPAISAGRRGTCIKVSINDTAIADVIECGFTRLLLERSTDGGLTYDEITTPDQRVVLELGATSYSITDRAGASNYLYRTRYIDTKTGECSEASLGIAGAGLAIRGFLSVEELKQRYLFGIDLTDDAGNELPPAVFEHYIAAAIARLEHELDIPILPASFCDFHDYYRGDYHAFNLIKLDNRPLISVEEFRVQYPSGQTVIVFPPEWFRLNKPEGQIQIVPTAGTLSHGGTSVELRNREIRLLEVFARHPGQILSKSHLMDRLFSYEADVTENAIEVYVGRLRKKLDGMGVRIETVRGMGYRLGGP